MSYKPPKNHPWKRPINTRVSESERSGYGDFMRGCEQPAQPLNDHYMRGWQQAADEGAKTNLDLCNRFTQLGSGLAMAEAAYEEITGNRPDCEPDDAEG